MNEITHENVASPKGGGKTYVRNPKSRQIVLLETTAHLLATTSTALPHMRRHVAGRASTQTTSSLLVVHVASTALGRLLDGGHGVLEGTASRKVLATANPTLDLLVLELILHAALLTTFLLGLLGLRLPVHAGTEHDVLTDGGGVE